MSVPPPLAVQTDLVKPKDLDEKESPYLVVIEPDDDELIPEGCRLQCEAKVVHAGDASDWIDLEPVSVPDLPKDGREIFAYGATVRIPRACVSHPDGGIYFRMRWVAVRDEQQPSEWVERVFSVMDDG